ncbi:MAG: CPBP family intramembrane metalloprotease [Verrucomicrobiota bacterium]|nr:CPBP family intramembrane metalloprotease [Verrucomicrobiota bacterium]
MIHFLPFLFLASAFLSLWIYRHPKLWGTLLSISLLLGLFDGNLTSSSLLILAGWALLWISYTQQKTFPIRLILFTALVSLSYAFKFHWIPGFSPVTIVGELAMGFDAPLVGFFPLALLVPLACSTTDWKQALTKGVWLTALGISAMALIAIASGTVHWALKWPSSPALRYLTNLIFTAMPEEAFYRGFIQRELGHFFQPWKRGKLFSLLLSSLFFAFAHLYWSPSLAILGFTFIAGLLYGGVYLLSGKIESAILCHFLLNFIHMTFFSYHAM